MNFHGIRFRLLNMSKNSFSLKRQYTREKIRYNFYNWLRYFPCSQDLKKRFWKSSQRYPFFSFSSTYIYVVHIFLCWRRVLADIPSIDKIMSALLTRLSFMGWYAKGCGNIMCAGMRDFLRSARTWVMWTHTALSLLLCSMYRARMLTCHRTYRTHIIARETAKMS